jgi:CHAT domain-containing protein
LLSSLPDDASLRAEYCLDHGWVKYYRQQAAAGEKLCERGRAELDRLPVSRRNEDTERMARSLASLHALFLVSSGKFEAALSAARFAVATAGPLSSHLLNLALCEDKAGLKLEALESLRRALEISLRDNPLGQDVGRILFVASALAEARNMKVALELHAATEALLDAQRTQFAGPDIKVAFDDAAHHREIAQTLVGRLIALGDYGGALEAADRSRARVLLELFDVQQDSKPEHQDRSTNAAAPPLEADPLAAFSTAAAFISGAAAKVVETAGAPLPLDRADIVDTVRRTGRPALVLQPEHDALHMFLVRPERTTVARSPVPLDEIRAAMQTAQEALGVFAVARARSGGKLSLADIEDDQTSTLDAALDTLSAALFAPFAILPGGQSLETVFSKRGLTLVPYRDLALLPFALLRLPTGQMLIEKAPLSMVPSIASLRALCMRKRPPPKGCVVYGEPILDPRHRLDPLPGAAAEARLVEKLLRASSLAPAGFEARLGADAAEASFRSDALDAALVHLACHAVAREPASQSALYLASSANHDGLLLPHEIADGQLANALVFLSACQTGLGRPTADGVIGLGRAFLEAGALAVILSLWRVADAAAVELAGHFYRAALGIDQPAADAAKALQIAMLATRASLRAGRIRTAEGEVLDDHPAHWAPFALVGEATLSLRENLQAIKMGHPAPERTP